MLISKLFHFSNQASLLFFYICELTSADWLGRSSGMSIFSPGIPGCITEEIYRETLKLLYFILFLKFTESLTFDTCIFHYSNYYHMYIVYYKIQN